MKDAADDLTMLSSRANPNFAKNFKAVFDFDDDLIDEIGKIRKEQDRAKLAYTAIKEAYAMKDAEIGKDTMRKIEREVYLQVLDGLWMQHLENMQHLREGIHWRSVGQRDPLVEYRTESQKLFDGLQKNLREIVLSRLLAITEQDAIESGLADGQEYESELTKMAESSTEKGVNEISKGVENIDNEFKSDRKPERSLNQKRNQARKSKKKQRQNKKGGRR
jgi:preprotein translocase subunit SecA